MVFNAYCHTDRDEWLGEFCLARYTNEKWRYWLSRDNRDILFYLVEESLWDPGLIRFGHGTQAKLILWVLRRENAMDLTRLKRTALAMAFHKRLGADSSLKWCPVDIIQRYSMSLLY